MAFGSTERARGVLIDTIYKARPTYSAMFFVDKVMLTHLAPAWASLSCRGTILFKGQRNLFRSMRTIKLVIIGDSGVGKVRTSVPISSFGHCFIRKSRPVCEAATSQVDSLPGIERQSVPTSLPRYSPITVILMKWLHCKYGLDMSFLIDNPSVC